MHLRFPSSSQTSYWQVLVTSGTSGMLVHFYLLCVTLVIQFTVSMTWNEHVLQQVDSIAPRAFSSSHYISGYWFLLTGGWRLWGTGEYHADDMIHTGCAWVIAQLNTLWRSLKVCARNGLVVRWPCPFANVATPSMVYCNVMNGSCQPNTQRLFFVKR